MSLEYPSIIRRYSATLIDLCLLAIVALIVASAIPGDAATVFRLGLIALVVLTYEPLCTSRLCTAGQYAMRFRVRHSEFPRQRISIGMAYLRFVLKVLLGWYSFVSILFSERKRAVHDIVAGSVVVESE